MSLPVLSLADLATPEGKARLVSQFKEAATTTGFLQLVDHGIPPSVMDGALEACKAFFHLPLEEKTKLTRNVETNKGYERMGAQSLYGQADARGNVAAAKEFAGLPDQKEGFCIGKEFGKGEKGINDGRYLHGPNMYPEESTCPGFRDATRAYYDEIRRVAEAFVAVPSLALGKNEDYILSMSRDPVGTIRLLRYPPQEHPGDVKVGAGAHTDFGFFTFLATFGVPGLQVWLNEQWVDVDPVPGSLIVNIGDAMSFLTNGHFISSLHRVLNVSSRERFSIPFFYEGDNDAMLDPPGKNPVRVEDFLRSKYENTYVGK